MGYNGKMKEVVCPNCWNYRMESAGFFDVDDLDQAIPHRICPNCSGAKIKIPEEDSLIARLKHLKRLFEPEKLF
ncbi:MAG: hypothetical protein U5L10_00325 [Candidatus Moranbacteria bacterium]|nr:hypothetical protein [Candidatus Moranbacteria bacterium]